MGRITTILIYSLPIQPQPVFKRAVIRSKDLFDGPCRKHAWTDRLTLKRAEETMDLAKNKHGLMNTQACRKTVHLLELKTRTDIRTLDWRCRKQELAESTHSNAGESFVRAWSTEDHSCDFTCDWSELTLLDITNHLLISDCILTS